MRIGHGSKHKFGSSVDMGGRFEKLKPAKGTCAARPIDIHGRTVSPPIRWVDRRNCELLNGFKECAARKQKGVE